MSLSLDTITLDCIHASILFFHLTLCHKNKLFDFCCSLLVCNITKTIKCSPYNEMFPNEVVWRERLNRTKFPDRRIRLFCRIITNEREFVFRFDWIIFHWNESDVFTHHRVRFKRHQCSSQDTLPKQYFVLWRSMYVLRKAQSFAKMLVSEEVF